MESRWVFKLKCKPKKFLSNRLPDVGDELGAVKLVLVLHVVPLDYDLHDGTNSFLLTWDFEKQEKEEGLFSHTCVTERQIQ